MCTTALPDMPDHWSQPAGQAVDTSMAYRSLLVYVSGSRSPRTVSVSVPWPVLRAAAADIPVTATATGSVPVTSAQRGAGTACAGSSPGPSGVSRSSAASRSPSPRQATAHGTGSVQRIVPRPPRTELTEISGRGRPSAKVTPWREVSTSEGDSSRPEENSLRPSASAGPAVTATSPGCSGALPSCVSPDRTAVTVGRRPSRSLP
ncbi:hypothetical protein SALBM135S_08501 [Streptomyces alboniger]